MTGEFESQSEALISVPDSCTHISGHSPGFNLEERTRHRDDVVIGERGAVAIGLTGLKANLRDFLGPGFVPFPPSTMSQSVKTPVLK